MYYATTSEVPLLLMLYACVQQPRILCSQQRHPPVIGQMFVVNANVVGLH